MAAVALATLLLSGRAVAHADSSAAAGFTQATASCWPGPSGNVCARMLYESSTKTWRAYGAADPNPGRSIKLNRVYLTFCPSPTGADDCRVVGSKPGSGSPTAYQRVTVDGKGAGCYWKSTVNYSAAGRTYERGTALVGIC